MKHNRLPAVLLALILCLTMNASPALAEAAAASDDEVFVIVHTNDVHGFIDVEPYVKAVADGMKAEYGDMTADGAMTERFREPGTKDVPHHGWNLPVGEDSLIAVDLWMNSVGMCLLAYEQQSRQ